MGLNKHIEKMNMSVELLKQNGDVIRDIIAKYNLLADSFVGDSSRDIVYKNESTYTKLLSTNIIDFVYYLISIKNKEIVGELTNNNFNSLFLGNKIWDIRKDLKSKGWNIGESTNISELKTALQSFGLEDTTEEPEDYDDAPEENSGCYNFFNEDPEWEDVKEVPDGGEGNPEEPEDLDIEDEDTEDSADEDTEGIREFMSQQAKGINNKYSDVEEAMEATNSNDEKIRKYIKEQEERRKRQQVESALQEADESVDKDVLNKTVNSIMNVYDIIYAPMFEANPCGVLTSSGVLSIRSDNALNIIGDGKVYALDMYKGIKGKYGDLVREYDYHNEELNASNLINSDGSLIYNYIPNFHARNIFGVYRDKETNTLKRQKNWIKFRQTLVKSLTGIISSIMKEFNGNILKLSGSLVELFTNVIIIEEFDINKLLKASIKFNSINNEYGDCSGIGQMIKSGQIFGLDTSMIEIINNGIAESGVHELLVVFDKKAYKGEILFAYKPLKRIIESGGKVGIKHTLLGRDLLGHNVTFNFASVEAICSLVIAGSRSGKGVVTLNMLATFIADGCPTIYLDWKPDMAAMLWNIERSTGARILAIDGLTGRADGSTPVRDYGTGYNKPVIPGIDKSLNVIAYVKMIQLMILCAKARNIGRYGMSNKGKKVMFILDEAQVMNKAFSALKIVMADYLGDNKPSKSKDKTESPEYKYVKRLSAVFDSLYSGIMEFRNATAGKGNVGVVMLGQQGDCKSWAEGAFKRDPIGFLVGTCSMKLLGKGASGGNTYELNGCRPKGEELLGEMGHFALVPKAVASKSDSDIIKVVKTCLVLNENDYDENNPGPFTSAMLSNIADPTVKEDLINNDLYPYDENGNRYVNKLVGFEGLVEYLGKNIENFDMKGNLENGYLEIEKLLVGLGILGEGSKYKDIEGYLFDCSEDSLFTCDELGDLINSGEKITSLIDMGGDTGSGDSNTPLNIGEKIEVSELEGEPLKGNTGSGSSNTPLNSGDNIEVSELDGEPLREMGGNERNYSEERTRQPGGYQGGENIDVEYNQNRNTRIDRYTSEIIERAREKESKTGDDIDYNDIARTETLKKCKVLYSSEYDSIIDSSRGIDDKNIYVSPSSKATVLGLNSDNSIVAMMPPYDLNERYENRLFRTIRGAQYQLKNRWKTILNKVDRSMGRENILRCIIMEDIIVFNKKQVATVNILGGDNDIRIEDIVSFKEMAKRYKNLKELKLDEIIFETAQCEFGNAVDGLFNNFRNLNRLIVLSNGCTDVDYNITRMDWQSNIKKQESAELEERVRFKRQVESVAAAKNRNLRSKSPGYQSRVWESTKSFGAGAWGNVTNALMAENPKLLKATFFGISGLAAITIGSIFYAGGFLKHRIFG